MLGIENCEYHELGECNIKSIIEWLNANKDNQDIDECYRTEFGLYIDKLNKILDETDFDEYKLTYYAWW